MIRRATRLLLAALLVLAVNPFALAEDRPAVRMTTSLGVVEMELYPDKAPATVKNFLSYVDAGFYDGTIFHRVIPGFMIQGGGFEPGMKQKPTREPVRNEADNGLKNTTGTLAMARTMEPHSATAQFFINVADNDFLDHRDKSMRGWGYAVFGKVTQGMEVVQKIVSVTTTRIGPHQNVPAQDVVITRMERVGSAGM